MSVILLINKLFVFLIIIIGPLLAIWVYFVDPKEKINKLFSFTALLAVVWTVFVYLAFTAKDENIALFWSKFAVMTVMSLLISLYFLSVYFPRESKRPRIFDKIIILFGIIFLFLGAFTNFIVNSVIKLEGWGFSPILGKIGFVLNGGALFITASVLYFIFKKYVKLSQIEKLKIQYFLIGIFIFIISNIIFNIFWPIFLGEYRYAQIGTNSVIFLLGLTAYAIVARELFGIRVILTQALVGAISILLLWQALVAVPNWLEFSWKIILFVLFLIFGYFLIKSVILEIRRRAELQKLYDELEKLDEAKTEFMSIVSHQLRTPLTAIKGYVSMIMEGLYGNFAEKMKKPLDNVFASNERLIKFVNDILNVTRIETGRLEFIPEKTSMEEVISSVVFELEIKSKEKNLYLKWDPPPKFGEGQEKEPLPQILIDPDKIRQVILNLIDNAIKYTKEGGVTVKCKVQNEKYRIEVSDTGAGMTKEDIEKLFRSFSRGESGVTYYKEGTGLGLYIARQFVELQGGKVWAESEGKGKGSTFYIELPIK